MQVKKTIVTRESIEHKVKETLAHPVRPTYDWMYDLGLTSTQREVYVYLFDILRQNYMREFEINTEDMAKKIGISIPQCSLITRTLSKAGLIYKRTDGKKCFYSLYPNLLTA